MHKFAINMGDWSNDGHGKWDKLIYESNYPVEDLQKAYKQSCQYTGIQLHDVCAQYEEYAIEPETAKKLLSHGCDENLLRGDAAKEYWQEDRYSFEGPEGMADVVIWFAGLSMPEDFECKRSEGVPNFNAFWGDLNVSFGYGLYF